MWARINPEDVKQVKVSFIVYEDMPELRDFILNIGFRQTSKTLREILDHAVREARKVEGLPINEQPSVAAVSSAAKDIIGDFAEQFGVKKK